MGTTRIFVTASKADADQTAAFWKNLPDNYTVTGFGPTAKVEVGPPGGAAPSWASAAGGPWYGVLVTKPDAVAAAASD